MLFLSLNENHGSNLSPYYHKKYKLLCVLKDMTKIFYWAEYKSTFCHWTQVCWVY